MREALLVCTGLSIAAMAVALPLMALAPPYGPLSETGMLRYISDGFEHRSVEATVVLMLCTPLITALRLLSLATFSPSQSAACMGLALVATGQVAGALVCRNDTFKDGHTAAAIVWIFSSLAVQAVALVGLSMDAKALQNVVGAHTVGKLAWMTSAICAVIYSGLISFASSGTTVRAVGGVVQYMCVESMLAVDASLLYMFF